MLSEREVSAAIGSTAYGANGDKLGTVEHFFVDDRTGAPTWVAVTTGLFGTRHSSSPRWTRRFDDGGLRLPVTADAVKSAPHLAGDHLDPADEAELRRHYGVGRRHPDAAPQSRHRRTGARRAGWLPPADRPPPTGTTATADDAAMRLPRRRRASCRRRRRTRSRTADGPTAG